MKNYPKMLAIDDDVRLACKSTEEACLFLHITESQYRKKNFHFKSCSHVSMTNNYSQNQRIFSIFLSEIVRAYQVKLTIFGDQYFTSF